MPSTMRVSTSISVDIAAISGRSDAFSDAKMYTGHGVEPATATNDETTVLSRLRVNASSAPEMTAGRISGSVMSVNRRRGGA
jgi:hypothetical protein